MTSIKNDTGTTGLEHSPLRKDWRKRLPVILLLHVFILVYSLASVCSKMASQYEFLSLPFILWYCADIGLLGLYALGWQQVLKHLALTTAYANKGVTIMWGFLWGALLFSEYISVRMYIGAAIVFIGVVLVVTADE